MRRAAAIAICSVLTAWVAAVAAGEAADPDPKSSLNTITVQGRREVLERQEKSFVSAIAVAPFSESLARWRTPICPLVAGLPRDHGEFILNRFSQIAQAAGAPLAPEHCRGNLYIFVPGDSGGALHP